MATQLQDEGFAVGRAKARRLMQEAGVSVRRPRARGPLTTDSRHGYGVADNVLARQCDVAKPDQAWAGDITYIWTAEGWLYLSALLDVFSRKGVGWAMRSHIDTALVHHALGDGAGTSEARSRAGAPFGPRESICQSCISQPAIGPWDRL